METVRGLPVPPRLTQLLTDKLWQHPGDDVILRVIPFMADPLVFPDSLDRMAAESRLGIADLGSGDPLRIHRGSGISGVSDLPWLDIERAFFIAYNKFPGDDVAVALDYRWNVDDPCVVASEYTDADGYNWRRVAETFSAFAKSLGM